MKTSWSLIFLLAVASWAGKGEGNEIRGGTTEAGTVTAHSRGLHGYIGYSASRPVVRAEYGAGMGFYAAVWPLIDKPIAHFQIGRAS